MLTLENSHCFQQPERSQPNSMKTYLGREAASCFDNSFGYKNKGIVVLELEHKMPFDCNHQMHLIVTNQRDDLKDSWAAAGIEEIVADLLRFDKEKMMVAENSPTQTNETRTKALVGVQSY